MIGPGGLLAISSLSPICSPPGFCLMGGVEKKEKKRGKTKLG
jgi:hypothetical protein